MARRYTVDAIRALVEVARLPPAEAPGPKSTAAAKLLEIGYPGIGKITASPELDALHQHLLAVQQIVPPDQNDTFTDPPADDGVSEIFGQPGLLPPPSPDLPDEALPLWDHYRTRRTVDVEPQQPEEGGSTPGWEPMPWPDQC